jgi:hypothetical protein
MISLSYRGRIFVDDLLVGECTIHRCFDDQGGRWWNLWFSVRRQSDNIPDIFCVPVNPNKPPLENSTRGKTWGLSKDTTEPLVWNLSPSVNILGTRDPHPGTHERPSLWHDTIRITDAPEGEAWITQLP